MVTRRKVLAGMGAAALVYGFDPQKRVWVADAHAHGIHDLPSLDGTVVTDPATLQTYADDVGNIVRRVPRAVLLPGSVDDIRKMIRFARRHEIKVAGRGQGHTTFGQSQVAGGLIVDMGALNEIHAIESDHAILDAGATWRSLVEASVPQGLTPPVLTGYINLSIGGTLSVGGVSRGNSRGTQVDRVRALEVVTGAGDREFCSRDYNRKLFEACLAGLGQCAVITKAVVDLVPTKPMVRNFLLNHTNNAAFFNDLRTLINRGEFDDVYMLGVPDGGGGFVQQINAGKYFDPAHPPDDDFLLRDLLIPPAAVQVVDDTYLNYALSVDAIIDFFRSVGLFDDVLHPWFDAWLPESKVEGFVGNTLANLTPEDVGPTGFLLLFPQRRSKLDRPFLRVPDSGKWVYLFDILTAAPAPGPNPDFARRMLARNRGLYEQVRRLGGTLYPIGATALERADWRIQYGPVFDEFKAAKRRFDPDNILTPGPGIF
jgi:cytokinin dehydrogenase